MARHPALEGAEARLRTRLPPSGSRLFTPSGAVLQIVLVFYLKKGKEQMPL